MHLSHFPEAIFSNAFNSSTLNFKRIRPKGLGAVLNMLEYDWILIKIDLHSEVAKNVAIWNLMISKCKQLAKMHSDWVIDWSATGWHGWISDLIIILTMSLIVICETRIDYLINFGTVWNLLNTINAMWQKSKNSKCFILIEGSKITLNAIFLKNVMNYGKTEYFNNNQN